MPGYRIKRDADGTPFVFVRQKGRALLRNATYNKGSAFTAEERKQFRLEGLLPSAVSSAENQLLRAYAYVRGRTDLLEQYFALVTLQERNETLFYRLILEHLEEFAPVIYTPVAALACEHFGHTFRLGSGMWITPEHVGRVERVLGNTRYQDIRLVVVTDNERCFGLGDKGAGGICVPIGKLVIYAVAAGIHPTQMLAISLDVGTNNQRLLDDPLYLGWRHKRLRGESYEQLVEELVAGLKKRFPRALLQWEDLKKRTAITLLDRYRDRLPSFSDDVQCTASVALAAVLASIHRSEIPLAEQRVIVFGAGAAGIGIARLIRVALARAGLRGTAVTRALAVIDRKGLLVKGRSVTEDYKKQFVWPLELIEDARLSRKGREDLLAMVKHLKPTVLIGASGQPWAFTEKVIRALGDGCRRPTVIIVSSPTSKAEAKAEDVIRWSEGRAQVVTWSHGTTVKRAGRTIRVSHGQNGFVAPGVALGALVSDALCVSDSMFVAAAEELARAVPRQDSEQGALLPPVSRLRTLTQRLARAVAREAIAEGVASSVDEEALPERIAELWRPVYVELRRG